MSFLIYKVYLWNLIYLWKYLHKHNEGRHLTIKTFNLKMFLKILKNLNPWNYSARFSVSRLSSQTLWNSVNKFILQCCVSPPTWSRELSQDRCPWLPELKSRCRWSTSAGSSRWRESHTWSTNTVSPTKTKLIINYHYHQ